MPVARDASHSPRQNASPSPEPPQGAKYNNQAGPSKKPKFTTNDVQRRQLEKLFENPDKEIQMPTGPKERSIKPAADIMKNVQGSSAGAGSGEFHVYKQSRRREYERLKIMEDKNRALDEQREFMERQAARDAVADAKTAKNRAKRQKRKAGRKGDKPEANGSGGATNAGLGGGGGGLKRKLESGPRVLFKRPGEESDEDDEEDDGQEEVGPTPEVAVPEVAAPVRVVEEARILIHDDE